MARYIDADLLKQNCKITSKFDDNFKCVSLQTLGEVIDAQPTADVAPIVHGEWIPQDMTYTKFMCNQCNSKNHSGHEKFCPNCGADMRKKVEE